jgi:hypothetical protein
MRERVAVAKGLNIISGATSRKVVRRKKKKEKKKRERYSDSQQPKSGILN